MPQQQQQQQQQSGMNYRAATKVAANKVNTVFLVYTAQRHMMSLSEQYCNLLFNDISDAKLSEFLAEGCDA